MAEAAQAFQWVLSTMQGDSALTTAATGGLFQDFAPDSAITNPPYVIFGSQSGTDALTMNVKRLFVRLIFQMKAIGPANNYAALVTIADRIDALFGRTGQITLSV